MALESAILQRLCEPSTEYKTQITGVSECWTRVVYCAHHGLCLLRRSSIPVARKNKIDHSIFRDDRCQYSFAGVADAWIDSVLDLTVVAGLEVLANAFDGFIGALSIVEDDVALAAIKQCLDERCTLTCDGDDGVNIASTGDLDGKRANGCAGTIDD